MQRYRVVVEGRRIHLVEVPRKHPVLDAVRTGFAWLQDAVERVLLVASH